VILNVSSISFDINSSGTEMYVNFTWPKGIEKSLLAYRMDAYPTAPDDPLAHKIECSKRQYENNEGILIANPATGLYHASVFTYFKADGRRIYSSPANTIINNEPQREVYYSFSYKKARMSKKRTLSLQLKSKGKFLFPQFCVMGKYRALPLKRGDGDVVCAMQDENEIDGTRSFDFEVDEIRTGSKLKRSRTILAQYWICSGRHRETRCC
jgi:hypothetical protein